MFIATCMYYNTESFSFHFQKPIWLWILDFKSFLNFIFLIFRRTVIFVKTKNCRFDVESSLSFIRVFVIMIMCLRKKTKNSCINSCKLNIPHVALIEKNQSVYSDFSDNLNKETDKYPANEFYLEKFQLSGRGVLKI